MMPFYRLPYDGHGYFRFNGEPVVSFCTKKEAEGFAKSIGWAKNTVRRLGNRFYLGWGLYDLMRDAFVGECPVMGLLKLRAYGFVPEDHSAKRVQFSSDLRR
jgi:hypothetical protein